MSDGREKLQLSLPCSLFTVNRFHYYAVTVAPSYCTVIPRCCQLLAAVMPSKRSTSRNKTRRRSGKR